jgi:predicted HAD superfamily Cof-like phosphohydrolase
VTTDDEGVTRIVSSPAYMVAEFHRAIGSPVLDAAAIPDAERCTLRETLLVDECDEAIAELIYAIEGEGDLARIAKELADVIVVTYGAALEFGIDLDAVVAEVHRSNMTKAGGPRRADGKQLKPEGWEPPDVKGVLGL